MFNHTRRLPLELAYEIVAYLSPSDVWRSKRVCKVWNTTLSSKAVIGIALENYDTHDPADSARTVSKTIPSDYDARVKLMIAHHMNKLSGVIKCTKMPRSSLFNMPRYPLPALKGRFFAHCPGGPYLHVVDLVTSKSWFNTVGAFMSAVILTEALVAITTRKGVSIWWLDRLDEEPQTIPCEVIYQDTVISHGSKHLIALWQPDGHNDDLVVIDAKQLEIAKYECTLPEAHYGSDTWRATILLDADESTCDFLVHNNGWNPDDPSTEERPVLAIKRIFLKTGRCKTSRISYTLPPGTSGAIRRQNGYMLRREELLARPSGRSGEWHLNLVYESTPGKPCHQLLVRMGDRVSILKMSYLDHPYALWKGRFYAKEWTDEGNYRIWSASAASYDESEASKCYSNYSLVGHTCSKETWGFKSALLVNDTFFVDFTDAYNPHLFVAYSFDQDLVQPSEVISYEDNEAMERILTNHNDDSWVALKRSVVSEADHMRSGWPVTGEWEDDYLG